MSHILSIPAHDNFKIKFLLVPGWVTILGWVNPVRHRTRQPRASLVKERTWIDPDFQERSLTERFVSATALSFFGIIKNFDPGSFSHVTRMFV